FTVKVHALKSSARLVGALELSSQAAHLEECGNNGDIREIRDKLPALTGLLRKYTYLLASLAGVTLSQTDEADKPDIDPDEIEGAFLSIKDYAEAFDFDGAENIINELEKYKLPEKYRDKVKKLSEMIRNIDRDGLLNSL
ncbi:MAG: Hpt domain-containing protein, partial [Lachnospiraceae bacterium]|nr:Hpt domain-containing protein [Lachnospiraceae bacterium]